MKIILKENIDNLGSKGDIVNVAAGYGRNYLLPKKLALEVTSTNMKMIEMEQASLKKNLEKVRISYQDVITKINDVSLSFERKAGEKDTLFGSVSVADIKEALDKMSFEIEKKKILLKEPIKRFGNYTVPIKVFLDDNAEIKVKVVPEGGEEKAAKPVVDKTKAEPETKKTIVKTAPEPELETEPDKTEEKKSDMVETEKVTKEEEKERVEPVVEVPKEKEPEDSVIQESSEVGEDKTETEPEAKPDPEVETKEKEIETEKEGVEAGINEETPKKEEKDESSEKSKTSK